MSIQGSSNDLDMHGNKSMTANLNLNNNKIINATDPTLLQDASTKNYSDTKVSKSGDSMSGNLLLGGNIITGLDNTYPPLNSSQAGSWSQIVQLSNDSIASAVALDGSRTMTGSLNLGNHKIINVTDPTSAQDASTKNYVDTKSLLVDGSNSMTGNMNLGTHRILNVVDPTAPQGAATKNYVDNKSLLVDGSNSMTGNMNLGTHKIINVTDPTLLQDASTKNYVDTRVIKNQVGFIPSLQSNSTNRNRFIASASSEFDTNYQAFNVFAPQINPTIFGGEWATSGVTSNFWIIIQCPFAVRIWKFQVRGRTSGDQRLSNWRLEGSNDNITFTTLYTSTDLIGTNVLEYQINIIVSYIYYRIFAVSGETGNPGLTYWQIYSLDQIN